MKYTVSFRPEAEQEYYGAIAWYNKQKHGLGSVFLHYFEDRIVDLLLNPYLSNIVEENIRRAYMKKFPYAIFFAIEEKHLEILRIRHFSRLPINW